MDLVGTIRSAPLADLVIVVLLFVCLILGVVQGSIRRLLGIGAIVFSFLIAANTSQALGDTFASNWRQFDLGYNRLFAFLLIFVLCFVITNILIQVFYHRVELDAKHPIVDDIIGGVLGVVEGIVVLTILSIIFDTYQTPIPWDGDQSYLRALQDSISHASHIVGFAHTWIAPTFVHLLTPLLPSELTKLWP